MPDYANGGIVGPDATLFPFRALCFGCKRGLPIPYVFGEHWFCQECAEKTGHSHTKPAGRLISIRLGEDE